MSTPVLLKVAEIVKSRRDAYVQITLEMGASGAADRAGVKALERRDVSQMIDAFIALITEALHGGAREIRTFYLETLVPSLVAAGTPVGSLVGGVAEFGIVLTVDIVEQLPAEERAEARSFLARFFNSYIDDMAKVGLEAAKQAAVQEASK